MNEAENIVVKGIEESDGEHCEHCGAACPQKRVVVDVDGKLMRYGIVCTSQLIYGDKKKANKEKIAALGATTQYVSEAISNGKLDNIAREVFNLSGGKYIAEYKRSRSVVQIARPGKTPFKTKLTLKNFGNDS